MRTSAPLLMNLTLILILCVCALLCSGCRATSSVRGKSVGIYGATSAGITAAVQAARMGHSVVLIDCDGWIGGLTTSGLGATDIGNKAAIGGLAREFYREVKAHYDKQAAWQHETRDQYLSHGYGHTRDGDAAWMFEPSVASAIFARWLREAGVEVVSTRLDRSTTGIERDGARLVAVRCEDGSRWTAQVWLDCSYEGDLMAAAGVRYTVGRESNAQYGESLNGVQVANSTKHQFTQAVSAYRRAGDPQSGLLPGIEAGPGAEGSADHKLQAYCYRMCVTDVPSNRRAWTKPAGYDEQEYELLLRHFDAGSTMAPWHPLWMPNRKTDANNNGAVSTDWIGGNWDWPEASYQRRDELRAAHLRWQQGLMWTLAHHPRVPESVRREVSAYGPTLDEFPDTEGWPPLLYVREARRMQGLITMTEHHCMSRETVEDPVGLGAYTMDSHNVQRYVDTQGLVRNEGDVQVRVPQPYGISWRALIPAADECSNLIVPVCLSATHIALGSIRMEPVYMVLGQSAATAACLAIERQESLHQLPYGVLQARLLADGQVLRWDSVR